jgi:class 3 adenylate cyclase
MRNQEVFDADADPQESRRARRHRLYRFGAPVASVLLMAAGLVGIALYSYRSNRDATLALSNDLLVVVEQQVHLEVASYLQPAENALQTLAAAAFDPPFAPDNRALLERLGMHVLRDAPMVALVSVADAAGNYLMLRRNPDGGIDTKLMERQGGRLTTTWTRRDAQGHVIATEPDPKDMFDPRTRPWFSGALQAEGISWTDAYVFFTDKKPGVTASIATRQADGSPSAVIGVDISLDELSNFLGSLRVSSRSESLIVDDKGNVIAYRRPTTPATDASGEIRLTRIPELNEPLVTQAYDRLRVSGPGRSIIGMDGQRYIIVGSSLASIIARNWMLLFLVPESDFVGSVARNTRTSVIMSGAVIIMGLFLAGLLIRQGLVTDRVARLLASRERDMDKQERAFAELGDLASRTDAGPKQLPRFTEAAARATNAASVRIWRFESNRSVLCLDAYDRDSNGHTSGFEIDLDQCPGLFDPVLIGQEVLIDDVTKDKRLAGLRNFYSAQASGRNLLLVPLAKDEATVGYVALENLPLPAATRDTIFLLVRTFARWLGPRIPVPESSIIAARPASASRGMREGDHLIASAESLRTASLMDERQRHVLQTLNGHGRATSVSLFPQTTVLTLLIRDDALLSPETAPQGSGSTATPLADAVRDACGRHAIRYVKILGSDIVMADGFDGDPEEAAVRLANAALDLRDHCALLSRHHHGHTPSFAIGIDNGSAIGAPATPDAFNLWGDAVRVAQSLAATAAPGTIHVSQTAYDQLNSSFLFRRIGAYYLDQIGEMATFTLRGRL